MNCQLCQNKMEAYVRNEIDPGLINPMEEHLKECQHCTEYLFLIRMMEDMIQEEVQIRPDPNLPAKIMQLIESGKGFESRNIDLRSHRMIKTFIFSVSVSAAIFAGILAGSFYYTEYPEDNIPAEISYMNDAEIEAINLFTKE